MLLYESEQNESFYEQNWYIWEGIVEWGFESITSWGSNQFSFDERFLFGESIFSEQISVKVGDMIIHC